MYENLKVYRGTTFNGCIKLKDLFGEDFLISKGDKIIFGVKENIKLNPETNDEFDDILTKTITIDDEIMGEYPFKFSPKDTKLALKTYYYYVAIQFADGDYYQVAPYSSFEVKMPIGLSYSPNDNKIVGCVPRKSRNHDCICNKEEADNEKK